MSAAAAPICATAPPVSYSEPGTGRQDWTGFASDYRAKREAKHRAAVARTLQWADESAERGDYFDALAWLDTVEAIGDELPEIYEIRRGSWSAQLGASLSDRRTAPPSQPVELRLKNPKRTVLADLDDLAESAPSIDH
jgi:hypothetical protein